MARTPLRLLPVLALVASFVSARNVTLSNLALPTDSSGNLLKTGELSILTVNSSYWVLYVNDWGGCAGVDCCATSGGCASCCFAGPNDPCVYTSNHSVLAYGTRDFVNLDFLGVALSVDARRPGTEFRPQVIFCPVTRKFVMWYEDRWLNASNHGYAVAESDTFAGPFTTVRDSVVLGGAGRVGDYTLFIDADGSAFHVRTGLTIAPLASNYSAGAGAAVDIPNGGVEGPAMFVRNGTYYVLVGVGCCACIGGSNVIVYTASSPLGPYTMRGDAGSNKTDGHVFDAHSPYNYVTRAQQTYVVRVVGSDGGEQWLWVGNAWVTSDLPGHPRDHDLLYFALLDFDEDGMVKQLVRTDNVTLSVPD